MADDSLELVQELLNVEIAAVKMLKATNAPREDYADHIANLKDLKKRRDAFLKDTETRAKFPINREALEITAKRRFFYINGFEIYGGVKGLFDLGPPGCALKNSIIDEWRSQFVKKEELLEIESSILTPYPVLKSSGHVDRFVDMMVKDVVTGDGHRADHVLEDFLEDLMAKTEDEEERMRIKSDLDSVEAFSCEELGAKLAEYDVKAPGTGNDLSEPAPFNLMFATSIGPSGNIQGFLRPETAQGIFVNFARLLDYNGNRMPFGCAQVGSSFRNEIAPRNALLRVRDFVQAEIEMFVHPDHKEHAKFAQIADTPVVLFPWEQQLTTRELVHTTFGEAVEAGYIDNETLAFFLAKSQEFFFSVGIQPEHFRFRQHLPTEMAHYASDCYDAEINTSYGWVEVAGHADRSCFDLTAHAEATNSKLQAWEAFDEPRDIETVELVLNKGIIGRTFRGDAKHVFAALAAMDDDSKLALAEQMGASGSITLATDAGDLEITSEMATVETTVVRKTGQAFTPAVIEPSFGIGRTLYCVLEHCFYTREGDDAERTVFRFPPTVAPTKVALLPLSNTQPLVDYVANIRPLLENSRLSFKVDSSGAAVGRRYARSDEIGIPFAITIDFQTIEDNTVTLRERDSMSQVRADASAIIDAIVAICNKTKTWEDVQAELPAFVAGAESADA